MLAGSGLYKEGGQIRILQTYLSLVIILSHAGKNGKCKSGNVIYQYGHTRRFLRHGCFRLA